MGGECIDTAFHLGSSNSGNLHTALGSIGVDIGNDTVAIRHGGIFNVHRCATTGRGCRVHALLAGVNERLDEAVAKDMGTMLVRVTRGG